MIRQATVSEIESDPALGEILAAYAAEAAIAGMPAFSPQMGTYRALEAAGLLRVYAAYVDGRLVGFLCLLVTFVTHYNARIATTESYFVLPEHRRSGAGLRLLREAERAAQEDGAAALFVSAPIDGKLAQVMQEMPGYRETNRVFFRNLRHD